MNKRIKKILVISIVLNVFFILFSSKIFARTIDTNIDGIDDNLYPGIKQQIKSLQADHPNWIFKVEYTDLTWEEVINGEHQGHSVSSNPSNLVPAGSNSYGGLWICEICGTQKYDTGSWYCASTEALGYMMDPRNSLNNTDLFQFMQLSGFQDFNNDTVRNVLKQMASNYPLIDNECIEATIQAANVHHVDPYYIMSKILEEQSTTSPLYTGSGYNGNYVGYYNLFNIGATAKTGKASDVIMNGLNYAASKGWDSKTKSILGGVEIIASSYISKEQDTLYYQKFDVIGDSKYQHQYQQNILGAQNAGTYLKKMYSKFDSSLSGNYSFIIPLYKNMPSTACPRPATNQSHTTGTANGILGDLNGDNQVNVIDVVILINYLNGDAELDSSKIAAAKVSGNADITVIDVVMLINYLNGDAVLPTKSNITATVTTSTKVRLSPNGVEFKNISEGASIKVLRLATNQVNDVYWDLIVGSNGVYGYIPRNYYQ